MPHDFLLKSALFQSLHQAFEDASGLPLVLEPVEVEQWTACTTSQHQNEFCRFINPGFKLIKPCADLQISLSDLAKTQRTATRTCYVGLCATAIALRYRGRVVAYLKTGQVFLREPHSTIIHRLDRIWEEYGDKTNSEGVETLKRTFLSTSRYSPARYQGTMALLNLIAQQLETWLESNFEVLGSSEPEMVHKARSFIDRHYAEDLSLDMIAQHAGVSSSYLCRQFKEVTHQTLTEYIGLRRIEASKLALSRKHARIGEVALEVGFQSLSQFNRTFSKLVGQTPSEYRKQLFDLPEVEA